MIEEIIKNAAENSRMHNYWLADTYASFPERKDSGRVPEVGTVPPIDLTWRSPFIGKSMQECADFAVNAPRDRGLCRMHFVVLDKQQYEKKEWVTCCKIMADGKFSAIPGDAALSTMFLFGYDFDMWDNYIEDWEEMRKPCMRKRPSQRW